MNTHPSEDNLSLAFKKDTVEFVTVAAAFCQLLRGHCTPSDYLASVNHPNRLGHEIIARGIMRWIPAVF